MSNVINVKFSRQLRKSVDAVWEASFQHPFVTGIADGSLPIECFRYYVLQDAYYLAQFARVQAYGAAKAPDLYTSGKLAAHVQGTYQAELSLHENFCKLLDVTDEEKARFEPAPTSYAYTSHLYRTACNGQLGDIIAAILPCYWLYFEIGQKLKGAAPDNPIYRDWIAAYGGEWFSELVQEQINRLDEIAEKASTAERARMESHFMISSKYEYMFWDMAYRQERWPV